MFILDKQWANLLSDFFLDIAKACFITAFIAPLSSNNQFLNQLLILIKALSNVIIYLSVARHIKSYELD